MSVKLLSPQIAFDEERMFELKDDFLGFVSGGNWSSVLTDTGSIVAAGVGGVATLLPSDGTVADNDQVILTTTAAAFQFASQKPFFVEALVQFAEVGANVANILFGVSTVNVADLMQDNGAGPPATYDGAVFFKADGDTNWSTETSIATVQTTNKLTANVSLTKQAPVCGGTAYQRLTICFIPWNSTQAEVQFWIDGVVVQVHQLTYTGGGAMYVVLMAKNGSGVQQPLAIDQFLGRALR
jgi:hypothetical protein